MKDSNEMSGLFIDRNGLLRIKSHDSFIIVGVKISTRIENHIMPLEQMKLIDPPIVFIAHIFYSNS